MDTNQITESAQNHMDNLQETAQETRRMAAQWAERARSKAKDTAAAADLYVREYPWTTVAIVGVAAIALGFLLGRTRD